ncbi:MAG: type II secretion system F family protein [Bacillota bacterium]|jgi:tight adherence protein C|nr:type II secretion system F family protein [Bacillota bacterium]MDD3298223.1 type II secretion system F family protein [Bacillota bacterium]MDD4707786.1 type II secretion system F family protein [Bacillota bacterium]
MVLLWLMLSMGGFVFFACQSVGYIVLCKKWRIGNRLAGIKKLTPGTNEEDALSKPLKERLLIPAWDRFTTRIAQMTPVEIKNRLNHRIVKAGYPPGSGVQKFLTFQGVLAATLPLLFLGMGLLFRFSAFRLVVFVLCGVIMGVLIPNMFLMSRITRRKKEIQRRLPDMLDLVTVSVEAGLGFDSALSKVVDKSRGVLSDELGRVMKEIRMGKPRHEALRDLCRRTEVEDLGVFVSAVIQADQLGVAMGNVMRVQ